MKWRIFSKHFGTKDTSSLKNIMPSPPPSQATVRYEAAAQQHIPEDDTTATDNAQQDIFIELHELVTAMSHLADALSRGHSRN